MSDLALGGGLSWVSQWWPRHGGLRNARPPRKSCLPPLPRHATAQREMAHVATATATNLKYETGNVSDAAAG